MPRIQFVNEQIEIEVASGANLRRAALNAGIPLYSPLTSHLNCHGLGLCGTCRVLVKSGHENLGGKTLKESIHWKVQPISGFAAIGHEDEIRLACQVQVRGDCSIQTHLPLRLTGDTFWLRPYPNK